MMKMPTVPLGPPLLALLLLTGVCTSATEVSTPNQTVSTTNEFDPTSWTLTKTIEFTWNGDNALTGGQLGYPINLDSIIGFGSPVETIPPGVYWQTETPDLPAEPFIWFDLTGVAKGQTLTVVFPLLVSPSAGSSGLVTGRVTTDTQGQGDDINQGDPFSLRPKATAGDSPQSEVLPSDPVQCGSGEFFLHSIIDISLGGTLPLFFSRMYASRLTFEAVMWSTTLGSNWMHNFELRVRAPTGNSEFLEVVYLGGKIIDFVADSTNPGAYLLGAGHDHVYRLVNTSVDLTGDFWFMDPIREVVIRFSGGAVPWATGFGLAKEVHDRGGNTLTLTHDANGLLTQVADGKGRTLTFVHDPVWWYLTSVSDGTRTVNYGYDVNGNLSTVTDALGNQTTYTYDANTNLGALLRSIERPEGNTPTKLVEYYINSADFSDPYNTHVTKVVDAYDNETTLSYDDPAPGKTTVTDPIGTTVVTHVDKRFTTELVDRSGNVTNYEYDASGRLTKLEDAETGGARGTIQFTHHPQSGKIASATNAEGNTTSFTYAGQNRSYGGGVVTFTFYDLTRIDYPDGTHEEYTYDTNGNRLTAKDQAGKTTTYTYDAQGRLLTQLQNPAQGTAGFTYNADDTMYTSTSSVAGTTTYEYDALRRLTAVVKDAGTADETRVQYTHDNADRVLTITNQLNQVTQYTYDKNGNLTVVKDPLNKTTTYVYDDMDRVVSQTDPEGNTETYTYDALGRRLTRTDGASVTTSYVYTPTGSVSQVTHGGQTSLLGRDKEGILTSVTTPSGRITDFGSNKLGDRTSTTTHPATGASLVTTYEYDSMRRQTKETDPLAHEATFVYDARGLLVNAGRPVVGDADYGRNAELGSLETVTDLDGQDWTSAYDALGRRTSDTDPLGNLTQYAYDSLGLPITHRLRLTISHIVE